MPQEPTQPPTACVSSSAGAVEPAAACNATRIPQSPGPRKRQSSVGYPLARRIFVNSQFFRGEVLNSSDIRAVNVARE